MDGELQEIECAQSLAGVDLDVVAVRLEVVDPSGEGFQVLLDCNEAVALACKLIGSVARLRGWETCDA
jgi:hypothetical protein